MTAPSDAASSGDLISDIYSLSDHQLAANLEFIQEIGLLCLSSISTGITKIRVVRLWELGLGVELSLQSWLSFTDQKKARCQARPQNERPHHSCSCSITVSYLPLYIPFSILDADGNLQMERNEDRKDSQGRATSCNHRLPFLYYYTVLCTSNYVSGFSA
jgi:hypothetical protein